MKISKLLRESYKDPINKQVKIRLYNSPEGEFEYETNSWQIFNNTDIELDCNFQYLIFKNTCVITTNKEILSLENVMEEIHVKQEKEA